MSEEFERYDQAPAPARLSSRPWYLGSILIGSVLVMGGLQQGWNNYDSGSMLPASAETATVTAASLAAARTAAMPAQSPAPASSDTGDAIEASLFDRAVVEQSKAIAPTVIESEFVESEFDPTEFNEPQTSEPSSESSDAVESPSGIALVPGDRMDTSQPEAGTDLIEQLTGHPVAIDATTADDVAVNDTEATTEPVAAINPGAPPAASTEQPSTYQLTIRPGDSLASRFDKLGVPAADVVALLDAPHAKKQLSHLRSGEVMIVTVNPDNSLAKLEYHARDGAILHLDHSNTGFQSELELPPPAPTETVVVEGRIDSSFYNAARQAGLSSSMRMQVSSMLAPVVNFGKQLRKGDTFKVLLEQTTDTLGNRKQRLVAAELINRGKVHRAIRYQTASGLISGFTPEGESLGVGFSRYPLQYTRISSPFSRHRWHPKLHRVRAHTGVDFAAPIGTPIKAPGDGRVSFYGRKSGYGRVLEIQHGSRYKTVYAHLSRFARGLRKGSSVRKGQTIAFVGKSGLATGPHLHYEFHIDGKPVDPLSARLPSGFTLPEEEREQFKAYAARIIAKLDNPTDVVVASSNATPEANKRL